MLSCSNPVLSKRCIIEWRVHEFKFELQNPLRQNPSAEPGEEEHVMVHQREAHRSLVQMLDVDTRHL